MPTGNAANFPKPGHRSTAAASSTNITRSPGSVASGRLGAGAPSRSTGSASAGHAVQHQQDAISPEPDIGDPCVVNLLYLDNPSLEMYHHLLYGRPYSTLVGRQHSQGTNM
jgi:hypothetical protein